MKIESLQNERVKKWCLLKEKKYRDAYNLFLIEGDHLVLEALKVGIVKEILTLEDKNYSVPTFQVTKEILKKISDQVTPPSVIAVCEKLQEKEIKGPVFILDGLQDPGNLGTILRSASAFSIPNIVLSRDSVDLYNPKVLRSTEGIFFSLNIVRKDLEDVFSFLKTNHYQIYGTDVKKGKDIRDCSLPFSSAFIIGNEGKGIRDKSRSVCDEFLYIPMNPQCESLNASVSASILMYEFSRERYL